MNKNKIDYKKKIEEKGDYECIKLYFRGDKLPNGKLVDRKIYAEIKHNYCGQVSIVVASNFIKDKKCTKCCKIYENSFAHHIEVELGLNIEDIWDFEKNEFNPYNITKKNDRKIWIKCTNVDYHDSYEITCCNFYLGKRCPYCYRNTGKVHPRDSFAQYHICNTDKDFLEKYWDYDKNTIDPFSISPSANSKVFIKCTNKEVNELNGLRKMDYHDSYKVTCAHFTRGRRCSSCHKSVLGDCHIYDSFGYKHLDKIMNWHKDNNISPFKVSLNNGKKYKFTCFECGNEWECSLASINIGSWCPECSSSKGEKVIMKYINIKNLEYMYDSKYFKDLLSNKGNQLRPDFILPKEKIWIEYDGEFHYKDYFKDGSYESLKINDKIKDEYANKHGWNLIRIPYWDFDNIENILDEKLAS